VTQHASLTKERWAELDRDRQILAIANEMNRASKLSGPEDRHRLANAYERVLRLVDLTVEVQSSRSLRRELLRWRELAGALYLEPDPEAHRALFRALLQLTPASAKQLPFLLGH
jgi:DNA-binding transcriptional regulator YbjK